MEIGKVTVANLINQLGKVEAEGDQDFVGLLAKLLENWPGKLDELTDLGEIDLEHVNFLEEDELEDVEKNVGNMAITPLMYRLNPNRLGIPDLETSEDLPDSLDLEGIDIKLQDMVAKTGNMEKLDLDETPTNTGKQAKREFASQIDLSYSEKIVDLRAMKDEKNITPLLFPEVEDLEKLEENSAEIKEEELLRLMVDRFKDREIDTEIKEIDIQENQINHNLNRLDGLIRQELIEEPKSQLDSHNMETIKASIIESMKVTKMEGSSLMEVQLHPKELGKVHIELKLEEGRISGRILVDNSSVKDLFVNSLGDLTSSLKKHDINMDNLDIDLNKNYNSFNQDPNTNHNPGSNKNFQGQQMNYFKSANLFNLRGQIGKGVGGQTAEFKGAGLNILV